MDIIKVDMSTIKLILKIIDSQKLEGIDRERLEVLKSQLQSVTN